MFAARPAGYYARLSQGGHTVVPHDSTFAYLKPTDVQVMTMERLRTAAAVYAELVVAEVPDGPDRDYALRKFREVAMWVNIALTREQDGSPRH